VRRWWQEHRLNVGTPEVTAHCPRSRVVLARAAASGHARQVGGQLTRATGRQVGWGPEVGAGPSGGVAEPGYRYG
jgi:hypothetical protein